MGMGTRFHRVGLWSSNRQQASDSQDTWKTCPRRGSRAANMQTLLPNVTDASSGIEFVLEAEQGPNKCIGKAAGRETSQTGKRNLRRWVLVPRDPHPWVSS